MKATILLILIYVVVCFLLGCGIFSLGPLNVQDNEINNFKNEIESQLNSILTFSTTDELNDFAEPGSGAPPSGVYPYSPIDIKKVSIGTTQSELYIKAEFADILPPQDTKFGNKINKTSTVIAFDTDQNPNSGVTLEGGVEMILVFCSNHGVVPHQSAYFYAQPTGIHEPEEERYAIYKGGRVVMGGVGSNYVVYKFSLADLGLQKGQTVDLLGNSEVESDRWHHFSFDSISREAVTL